MPFGKTLPFPRLGFQAGIRGGWESRAPFSRGTEAPGFSRREFATPSSRSCRGYRLDTRRAGKARRSSSYLSHDALLSPLLFLTADESLSSLIYPLLSPVSSRERCECTNQRTHAPRSVATAVGAGRCLQSNCGGSSTVAPPKDAAVAATTTIASYHHRLRSAAAIFLPEPSRALLTPSKTFRFEMRAFRSRVRERTSRDVSPGVRNCTPNIRRARNTSRLPCTLEWYHLAFVEMIKIGDYKWSVTHSRDDKFLY